MDVLSPSGSGECREHGSDLYVLLTTVTDISVLVWEQGCCLLTPTPKPHWLGRILEAFLEEVIFNVRLEKKELCRQRGEESVLQTVKIACLGL